VWSGSQKLQLGTGRVCFGIQLCMYDRKFLCVFLLCYWALSERKKVIGLLLPAIEPDDRF